MDDTTFSVTIHAATTTTHQVRVQTAEALRLTQEGRVSHRALVEKSFEFLLAREPNTSILRSFELSVISHYFSDYEREIAKLLNL
jgi:hypothetical protein